MTTKPKTRYGYVYHFVFTRPTDGRDFHYIGQHVGEKVSRRYFGSGFRLRQFYKKYGIVGNVKRHGLMWCYSKQELTFAETLMICFAREIYGRDCINLNHGGANGRAAASTRKKMVVSRRDYLDTLTNEDKAIISANMSAARKGEVRTKEHRTNISVGMKAHFASSEGDKSRTRIGYHNKARVVTEETRTNMSASQKARFASPEGDKSRTSISLSNQTRVVSNETRAKRSASMKANWARRKSLK